MDSPQVLVLVSDGRPTDDFLSGIRELEKQPWGKRAVRLAIGIGTDADLEALQRFTGNLEIKPLCANSPELLTRYIRWVSTAVLQAVSTPVSQASETPKVPYCVVPSPPEFFTDKYTEKRIW